jgi:hypothetical protein
MPEISRFYGIIIGMFYNEHMPPHFHAKYGEHEIELDIINLKIIKGDFPNHAKSLVLEWTEKHKNELLIDWEPAMNLKVLNKIEPLE